MKYFICGFSGAGKSSLLRRLAATREAKPELLGCVFLDLDEEVLAAHSSPASCDATLGPLIEERGWGWFRREEQRVLRNLLERDKVWIALGGGTLSPELAQALNNREDVKGYWLNTDFETCWSRIKDDPNRPMARHGKEKMLELYRQREQIYSLFQPFPENFLE